MITFVNSLNCTKKTPCQVGAALFLLYIRNFETLY